MSGSHRENGKHSDPEQPETKNGNNSQDYGGNSQLVQLTSFCDSG